MITLYGDHVIKLDSGPRISLPFLVDLLLLLEVYRLYYNSSLAWIPKVLR